MFKYKDNLGNWIELPELENGKIQEENIPPMDYVPTSQKGAANGVVPLNSSTKIADTYLPSYVSKASGSLAFSIGRDADGIYVEY